MEEHHGMKFEDVRTRVKRMEATQKAGLVKNHQQKDALTKSLINQAELRDKGAAKEIVREMNHKQSKWI